MSAEELYDELLTLSDEANHQFIITARPAEEVPSPEAAGLTRILLRRTGLLRLAADDDWAVFERLLEESRLKYFFNFPSIEHGEDWWRALSAILIGEAQETRRGNVNSELLRRAITLVQDHGIVRVRRIPENMCGCPTVVFNPHLPEATGFNLYYHQDQQANPARMDSQALMLWKKYVYRPLDNGSVIVEDIRLPPERER